MRLSLRHLVAAIAAVLTLGLAACGGGENNGTNEAGNNKGSDAKTVQVEVAPGAFVDADPKGGDQLLDVGFKSPVAAVCDTGERVGVIPAHVGGTGRTVENWTNAGDKPVVFLLKEEVQGDVGDLPPCSESDGPEDKDAVLHGFHVHQDHANN